MFVFVMEGGVFGYHSKYKTYICNFPEEPLNGEQDCPVLHRGTGDAISIFLACASPTITASPFKYLHFTVRRPLFQLQVINPNMFSFCLQSLSLQVYMYIAMHNCEVSGGLLCISILYMWFAVVLMKVMNITGQSTCFSTGMVLVRYGVPFRIYRYQYYFSHQIVQYDIH